MKRLLIAIPAYNEEPVLGAVIGSLPCQLTDIDEVCHLVVDDGSDDATAAVAKDSGAIVISHPVNTGLGGATRTAFAYAREQQFDFVVTLDADGQHRGEDIERVLWPVLAGEADLAIGQRQLRLGQAPLRRILGNRLMNILTAGFAHQYVRDSQSGFRAFNLAALHQLDLRLWGMEHNSETVIQASRAGLRVASVPIPSIYSSYSLKKGQTSLNGLSIIYRLMTRR